MQIYGSFSLFQENSVIFVILNLNTIYFYDEFIA